MDALWPSERELALLTDLYELTMAQAYWRDDHRGEAVFSLFFRKLPAGRRFAVACGQEYAAHLIRGLRFYPEQIERLRQLELFEDGFLRWLADFRFEGEIRTLPEGSVVFPNEPLLEVRAPVIQGQLLESLLMNYVNLETLLASKAARMVLAADGVPVVDFGMRRMHGLESAWRGVRAYRVAGIAGTSNVLGGLSFDLPVRGTMAHSYIQSHDDETEALRRYARDYPGTTLLVDTYDTLRGVDRVRETNRERVELGRYILASLELFIVSDIIHTALSLAFADLLFLGLLVVIRSVISYFLDRELDQLRKELGE